MTKFPYRTALITGASSGIGKAFAYQLAQKGVHLVITARSEQKLEEIAQDLKSKFAIHVSCIAADLTDPQAPQNIEREIRNKKIFIELLINNAGIGKWTNFLDQPPQVYHEMIQLNISSLVTLSHLFLPAMLKNKKGGIINIASTGALQPCPYIAVYCASKSFVLNFSESLHGEYFDKGITVTAICPGNTQTGFQETANANTKGMQYETPQWVAKQSIDALLSRKNNKIIGWGNRFQSLIPRLFPRKMVINLVKKMMDKKVNQ